MNEIAPLLEGLNAQEAKRRERAIRELSPQALQDPQVIEALQKLVSSDPAEYVREAARAALVSAGQTPAASLVPVQLKQESNTKAAAFGVGCALIPVVVCIVLVVLVVAAVVIFGLSNNLFSRELF